MEKSVPRTAQTALGVRTVNLDVTFFFSRAAIQRALPLRKEKENTRSEAEACRVSAAVSESASSFIKVPSLNNSSHQAFCPVRSLSPWSSGSPLRAGSHCPVPALCSSAVPDRS